jgi:DNA (cytosine-5)-methyltransferase 1
MNELSLFSGAGGGLLGTKLLRWRCIGYVEWDDYCQQVLAARIKDGFLDEAPIFGDIRTFNDQYAGKYRGVVDVVTAGFPCQPFSVAGKRQADADERNMWPATIECIRLVRPRFALLENVSGLLAHDYFGTILGDLAKSGYDCRWRILSAAEVGAPHLRDRVWLVAHPLSKRPQRIIRSYCKPQSANGWLVQSERLLEEQGRLAIPTGKRGALHDGMAHRMDQLKALGNGQVPAVVAAVWKLLNED